MTDEEKLELEKQKEIDKQKETDNDQEIIKKDHQTDTDTDTDTDNDEKLFTQEEVNKMISKRLNKEKQKTEKETNTDEDPDEDFENKYNKLKSELDSANKELLNSKLKTEANNVLVENGIDPQTIDEELLLTFICEDEESTKNKVEKFASAIIKASDKDIKDRLKGKSRTINKNINTNDKMDINDINKITNPKKRLELLREHLKD